MSPTIPIPPAPAAAAPSVSYRRAYRPAEGRMVGGVAQGLSDHLGIAVIWVRLGFVVATWFNFAGVIAYAALWRLLPIADPAASTEGLESATRRGLRTPAGSTSRMRPADALQTAALLALGVGVCLLMQFAGWGLGGGVFIPALIGVAGFALIWRQADDNRWSRWVVGTSGWEAATRLALGSLLVVMSFAFFVAGSGGLSVATDVASALAVALVGIGLILGPWIYRLTNDLSAERRERIRSQERADVAAHLHDSVLQTLALLQKNASDPATVATLARRQERELRDWLYGADERVGVSLRATVVADAADIEEMHRIPIEVVGVGDAPMGPDVSAMARAAREAMTNAAKHSGAERIDVYIEVARGPETNGDAVDIFVRDRGGGFDPSSIAEDRMGIRGSIVDRMERHGGSAEVRSAPGDGTEVRLSMPLRQSDNQSEQRGRP